MDGTFGRDFDTGEPAHQALADFASSPAGMLALHVEDVVLYLKRQVIGIAIGAAAAIGQPFHPALLVAIENFIAGFAGNPELPAKFRHGLAGKPPSHELKPFLHN